MTASADFVARPAGGAQPPAPAVDPGRPRVSLEVHWPDRVSSDAQRDPVTMAVTAVARQLGHREGDHLVLDAGDACDRAARDFIARVDSGERVRPVDSLRLEPARLLAGLAPLSATVLGTAEPGDAEDLAAAWVETEGGGASVVRVALAGDKCQVSGIRIDRHEAADQAAAEPSSRAAWEHLSAALVACGVTCFVGLPADEWGLLDAAAERPDARVHVLRDQRAAALAAVGYAQACGRPAALCVTSGPAFTNTLTGLLEGASLGVPLVLVTTNTDPREVARGGFQVTPQAELARPLTAWFHHLADADDIDWTARRAVHLALTSRPGIVVIEVAHGLTAIPDTAQTATHPVPVAPRTRPSDNDIARAAAAIDSATRPLILAGGGSRGAHTLIGHCARRWRARVLTTAAGRGAVDEQGPFSLGCAGLYADSATADLVAGADLVVAVGTAFEETMRMGWPELGEVPVIQIDRDPTAFGRALLPAHALCGDAIATLELLDAAVRDRAGDLAGGWGPMPPPSPDGSPTATLLRALWSDLADNAILVQENGLHDMWSYDRAAVPVRDGTVVICPGEQTTVGFGLPAATGAAAALPGRDLMLVCGDSAAEMSIAALPTLVAVHPNPCVVVLDNRGWGWPRVCRTDGDRAITRVTRDLSFDLVAAGLGAQTLLVRSSEEAAIDVALAALRESRAVGRPLVVRVLVDENDHAPGVRRALDA